MNVCPKDKTLTITDEGLRFWWAHQDLNLGPKGYEKKLPKIVQHLWALQRE